MSSSEESDVIYVGFKNLTPEPPAPSPSPQKVVEGFEIFYDGIGQTFWKKNSGSVGVGREPSTVSLHPSPVAPHAIFYQCPVVSRMHAEFSFSSEHLFIADVGSHHGTWKVMPNGVLLKIGDVPSLVLDGDVYLFGKSVEKGGKTHNPIRATVNLLYSAPPDIDIIIESPTTNISNAPEVCRRVGYGLTDEDAYATDEAEGGEQSDPEIMELEFEEHTKIPGTSPFVEEDELESPVPEPGRNSLRVFSLQTPESSPGLPSSVTRAEIKQIRDEIDLLKLYKKRSKRKIDSNHQELDNRLVFVDEKVQDLKYVQNVLEDRLDKIKEIQSQQILDVSTSKKLSQDSLNKTAELSDVVMSEVQELRNEVDNGKIEVSDLLADLRHYLKDTEKLITEQLDEVKAARGRAISTIETSTKDLKRKRSSTSFPSTPSAISDSSKKIRLAMDISVPSASGVVAGAVAGGLATWLGLSFL